MIIKSKLSLPAPLKHGILRQRLFQHNTHYKLGLICAPAGYGKSTAIADWSRHKNNLAWFRIDSFDDNSNQFYNYFVHALDQLDGVSCPASIEAATQNQFPDLINLFSLLINELSEFPVPIAIVLDDYHHIKNPEIHQGISFFIKNMPARWQVLISSRTTPPLAVSNLRIKQQLFELSEDDLAFTELETEQFFSQSTTFYRDPIKQQTLCRNVDGWPTALQIVAILSKDSNSFSECAEQIGKSNHAYLWDYLEEEVFLSLTKNLQDLLLTIAPLNKVNADIVNELCNIANGQEQLERLQEQGAFLVAINDQPEWFTFHSFFKGFLLHKSEQIRHFKYDHKKIAQLWLARNNIEEALTHALLSQNEQLLIDLLKAIGWQLFDEGQLTSLAECFALIEDKIWDYPELILLKVWMLQAQHQRYKIAPLIAKSKAIFTEKKVVISERQKNEFTLIDAQIAINQGQFKEALKLVKITNSSTEANSNHVNMVAQAIIGEAYHYLGELPLAYQSFQQVKQLATQQQIQQSVIWALYQQAEILHAENNHHEAEKHIDAAISLINRYHLQKTPIYTFLLHFKAQKAYQEADFELAKHLCEHALKIVLPYGEQWYLSTYVLQAKIAIAKQDHPKSRQLIDEIESLLRNHHFQSSWIAAANDLRIKHWRITNNISAIKQWLNTAPSPTNAYNHFDQCHNRNRIRALLETGELQLAQQLLSKNREDAEQQHLPIEVNHNLILLSSLENHLKQPTKANTSLAQAIECSLQTGLTTDFICESEQLKASYQALAKDPSLTEQSKNKLTSLLTLSGIRLHEAPKIPFDSDSVIKIQAHSQVPRLVKNIQLTDREWQVLGFIHSGYRNPQIAKALGVAPTTVKSHIRNLYQKLGLEDRNEALQLSAELVALIN